MTKHNSFAFDDKPSQQEIFDRAVEFFFDPDMRQCKSDTHSGCVYTNNADEHCVLGYMLPTTVLDILLEKDWNIGALCNRQSMRERLPQWVIINKDLIASLQSIHDDPPKRWVKDKDGYLVEQLSNLASTAGLTFVDPTLTYYPFAKDADPTEQEIFDRAVKFFTITDERAMCADQQACVYTTEDGKRHCVAGYMMPSDLLKWLGQEAVGIEQLIRAGNAELPAWITKHAGLLHALQTIHDDQDIWTRPKKDYRMLNEELSRVAVRFALNFIPIPVPFNA